MLQRAGGLGRLPSLLLTRAHAIPPLFVACNNGILSTSIRHFSVQPTPSSSPSTPTTTVSVKDTLPSKAVPQPSELTPQKPPGTSVPDSFAIVHVAGHQYKVTKGDTVLVDKLPVDIGDNIFLSKVLMIGSKEFTAIGTPLLKKAVVSATVEEQTETEKVIVFKKKRRKNYERTKGHKAQVTVVKINDIFMDYAANNLAAPQ